VQPADHRIEVLVLQHPQEQRRAKNSVALLCLSLAGCEVVVGDRFDSQALQALLHRAGQETWLLTRTCPRHRREADGDRAALVWVIVQRPAPDPK
jgi:DTW domain-containing protein YfiP